MQGWNKTGVRTEKVIVEGRVFDAPLVITTSGEILPLVVRFPENPPGGNVEVPALQKRHHTAEALIRNMDLILAVADASKKLGMRRAADEIVTPALQLTADAIRLYTASRDDEEVQRLCVLVARQVRMGLLSLTVRRAVHGALKGRNPCVVYRRFTRFPKTEENKGFLEGSYTCLETVTELSKHYRPGKKVRPPRGHVYEIIQSAALVRMPVLHVGQAERPPGQWERTGDIEFLPIEQASDVFEDLCTGSGAQDDSDSGPAESGPDLCYGDEPHLCCALPTVTPPSACCQTELHNLFVTRWDPWGTEETSALIAYASLLQDGARMCERMLCYSLNRRTCGELRVQAFNGTQERSSG